MANFNFHTTGNQVVETFPDEVRGKVFLVTGPSPGGLGAETAISLARAIPKLLILAGRSETKVETVINTITKESPEISVAFIKLDIGNQTSVREAVKAIKSLNVKVDVLINNAAVMCPPFSATADGIEMQFETNHLGPFLFTNLLIKGDVISKGGRIVNVSSSGSVLKPSMIMPHLDDLTYDNGKTYNPWIAYGLSKSANMLSTRSLAQRCRKRSITAFSLNPGSIKSELQRHITKELVDDAIRIHRENNPKWQFPQPKSLQQGCSTQLRAALDPALAAYSGSYLDDCQPIEYPEHIGAYPLADRVWQMSEQLVAERFGF